MPAIDFQLSSEDQQRVRDIVREENEAFLQVLLERFEYAVRKCLTDHHKEISKEPQLLTREETATALRCSLWALWSWEKEGILIPVRKGRKVLYPEDIVYNFSHPGKGVLAINRK